MQTVMMIPSKSEERNSEDQKFHHKKSKTFAAKSKTTLFAISSEEQIIFSEVEKGKNLELENSNCVTAEQKLPSQRLPGKGINSSTTRTSSVVPIYSFE